MSSSDNEPIVDVWMQHPTVRIFAEPMFDSLRRWVGEDTLSKELPLELTLDSMRDGGVRLGLVSAWWGPQGELIPNDFVAAQVAKAPDRLRGVASVDLSRPMEAVRELRRCVKELRFVGLRVIPWLWGLPPNDRRYYPLYAECIELGIPFCTQVGHTGPLRESEPGRPIPYLDQVALEFPELTIVGGHIGFPWTDEMVSLCRKYPNVYVDTSAYVVKRYPPELVSYLKSDGRKKVLFGTNYPMLTPARCLQGLDALGLDAETRRAFLWENAHRVFNVGS